MDATKFCLGNLADLEDNENIKDVHLHWVEGPSANEVLQMLKKCTHLRRLTLKSGTRPPFPSSEELCDFIMDLKHLTFLHIINQDIYSCGHCKSEVDEVKAFILPRRPNFVFDISPFFD